MRTKTALLLGALTMLTFVAMPAATAVGQTSTQGYIVQMLAEPVVAYDGGVAGLEATKPGKGKKIDPTSAKVQKYVDHLNGQHAAALGKVGGEKYYDYVYSFNGFAARMTDAQAAAMKTMKGVVAVTPDELRAVDTSTTPTFLGLDAPGGLWDQLGGPGDKKNSGAGENIIIGVVDSGIWPESKSFSDRDASGKLAYQNMPGLGGRSLCDGGEQFNASNCNQKLIAARYFNAAWGGSAALEAARPWEFMSPRDYNGHGTHTASTAGGNYGVQPTGDAAGFGRISGMAPRARIAAYKALWSTQSGDTASGQTGDLVEAIDTAVADGVDVINYSVSGTLTNFLDPVEVSFLFAADAGVFVAASAGNSGPGSSTVAHPGPWITTVAAASHNRTGTGSVTIDGVTYQGLSYAPAVTGALVDAQDVAKAPATPAQAALCLSSLDNGGVPVLDPAQVAGKIVLCERGSNVLVNKSLAVKEAGGIGMVLTNTPTSANTLFAIIHSVPAVHIPFTTVAAYDELKADASAGKTAAIAKFTTDLSVPAPLTASFSSRGPLIAGGGDLLKPDVIAPGVDILAAVAPPANHGRDFDSYQGTSMSSPHVAGLGALLKHLHPNWSPMAIKSALMTSGYDVLDGGTPAPNTNPVLIFRQGAGHVKPNSAADPGLVFDHGFNDWLAFLCGTTTGVGASTCNALKGLGYSTDPSDLNVASIAIGDLAGSQTVKRTVTNVGKSAATYNVSVNAPGFNVSVSPSSFTLGAGAKQALSIAITNVSATLNTYGGGQMTLSDGTHSVRIPLVLKPVALAAPTQVSGTGDQIDYSVKFGYTGAFVAAARGLIPAEVTAGNVADDPTDGSCTNTPSANKVRVQVAVPAGSTYARFSLFDADVAPGSDIDLCVFGPGVSGSSGTGTSAEEVNFVNPPAGTYDVIVHGWGVPGTSPFKLHSWVLGSTSAGNMTVNAPASATLGATGTISLSFSGLTSGVKYLGSVAYSGASGMPNPTIVRVDKS